VQGGAKLPFGEPFSLPSQEKKRAPNLPQACTSAAAAEPVNPNVPGSSGIASLNAFGCYMAGKSVIVPPAFGTNGNMYSNEITALHSVNGISRWRRTSDSLKG
jgi:hypothetical protein